MIRASNALALARFVLATGLLSSASSTGVLAQRGNLTVAAAADLKSAMDDLITHFEKEPRYKVNVAYGSSGNFFSQIVNGAPFDLFFSADVEYPEKLEEAGLVEPGTLEKYAVGQIVLWTPTNASVDVVKEQWRALLDPSVKNIAVANPEHAPYGRAAVAALRDAGIYEKVRGKLVYGEDVSQAAQFVQSGNAQLGIIAKSLAVSPALQAGKYWDIPAGSFPPIEQAAVVLKASAHKQQARAFLEFVRSSAGRAILEQYGFTVSQGQNAIR